MYNRENANGDMLRKINANDNAIELCFMNNINHTKCETTQNTKYTKYNPHEVCEVCENSAVVLSKSQSRGIIF